MADGSIAPSRTTEVAPEASSTTLSPPTGLPLPLHHGVYFKHLGETIISGSDWTVCTTLDLSKYENIHIQLSTQTTEVEGHLRQSRATLHDLRRSVGEDGVLKSSYAAKIKLHDVLLSSWTKLYTAVDSNLQLHQRTIRNIKSSVISVDADQSRDRRGLIDVVGKAGKALFGFSTEQDLADLKEKITRLSGGQNNLTHLTDQQFSYIKDVASQVLDEGTQIQRLELEVSDMSRVLTEIRDATPLELAALFTEFGLAVVSSLTMINDEIQQSLRALHSLQNIIAAAQKGSLSWELFDGAVFRDLLGELQDQLPQGWSLLYDVNDHYSYLKYARVNTYPHPEGLHLCVELPIIEASSRYHLFEAISLPIVHPGFPKNIYFMYHFDSPFLAMQSQGNEILTLASWKQSDHEYFSMDTQSQALCQGTDPRVCPLQQAVRVARATLHAGSEARAETATRDNCLHGLITDSPHPASCPAQVRYHEGPLFRNVGKGTWLYGAAKGELVVTCSNLASRPGRLRRYELMGTGAVRLQPGCEGSFGGNVRIPSYVHGHGRFLTSLPLEPIKDVFSLNFTHSLWHSLTANLTQPKNMDAFLQHLREETDIQTHNMNLKRFNNTILHYETLRNQLPAYHPLRWISQPKAQMSGFTILLVLILMIGVVLGVRTWRKRRGPRARSSSDVVAMAAQEVRQEGTLGTHRRLIRVRRIRRPAIADETV